MLSLLFETDKFEIFDSCHVISSFQFHCLFQAIFTHKNQTTALSIFKISLEVGFSFVDK
jgi:hypothetical protein